MNKKIEEMTVEEIKILAYDQIMLLKQTEQNIIILQNELQKRSEVKGVN